MTITDKTPHQILEEAGVSKDRLRTALDSNNNWGGMVHTFEYLATCSAVLATWPDEEEPSGN